MERTLPAVAAGSHIRRGEPGDAVRLSALSIQVWLHTYATLGISSVLSHYVLSEYATENLKAMLCDASSTMLIAEIGENLVGYAKVCVGNPCPEAAASTVELATLYVQEHFMGKGIGRALLQRAEQWAMNHAHSALWLTVNSSNSRAIAFYAKHGYTQLGITHFELGTSRHENLVLVGRRT